MSLSNVLNFQFPDMDTRYDFSFICVVASRCRGGSNVVGLFCVNSCGMCVCIHACVCSYRVCVSMRHISLTKFFPVLNIFAVKHKLCLSWRPCDSDIPDAAIHWDKVQCSSTKHDTLPNLHAVFVWECVESITNHFHLFVNIFFVDFVPCLHEDGQHDIHHHYADVWRLVWARGWAEREREREREIIPSNNRWLGLRYLSDSIYRIDCHLSAYRVCKS